MNDARSHRSPDESTEDKWARRSAARRAATSVTETGWVREPENLRRAFVLWLVIGLPLCLVLYGIVLVVAAFHLRAGYRGARIWLTIIGGVSFVGAAALIVMAGWLIACGSGSFVLPLLGLIPAGIAIAATILMWRVDVTDYFTAIRRRPQ